MTKKEMAMYNEMVDTVKALTKRIETLEKINKGLIADIKGMTRTTTVATVESKDSKQAKKPTEITVGNLVFSGKYVKTGTGFMSSKTRYAISQSIINDFGGTKLAKGNPVYDKCHKTDKYVQVYEFKTVADCKKFMAEQQKRVG